MVVECWAENVLNALTELNERVQTHRQTLSRVSSSHLRKDAGQETLLAKMEELQEKLKANEQREKAALLKIKFLGEFCSL